MTGSHWSLENPKSSMLWLMPPLLAFCRRLSPAPLRIELHMCAYGSPHRSSTSFLTTADCLAQIGKLCPGKSAMHFHEALSWRDRKTEVSQIYPPQLCVEYAFAASSLLNALRRVAVAAQAKAVRRRLARQAAATDPAVASVWL